MVCSLDSFETVSPLHLSVVAFITGSNIRQTEGIVWVIYPPFEDGELSADGKSGTLAHLHHDFAAFGQHETGFEEDETVGKRHDPGLSLVECDTDFLTFGHQGFLTYLQVVQTFVDEVSIVHIPLISFDPKLFLYHVIQRIGKHKSVGLRDLTSKPEPDGAKGGDELV